MALKKKLWKVRCTIWMVRIDSCSNVRLSLSGCSAFQNIFCAKYYALGSVIDFYSPEIPKVYNEDENIEVLGKRNSSEIDLLRLGLQITALFLVINLFFQKAKGNTS